MARQRRRARGDVVYLVRCARQPATAVQAQGERERATHRHCCDGPLNLRRNKEHVSGKQANALLGWVRLGLHREPMPSGVPRTLMGDRS